jgi:hypothetical protein
MYSSSTKVEYGTDIMLGRIVRFKKLSSATQRRYKKFCYAGASTACRLVVFSATFDYVWLEFCVSVCHVIMENYTNSEMIDMVLCYGSADGVDLRAQALYREKFPARRVPHSQTFLAIVYGKMVLFDCIRQQEFCE